MRKKIFHYSDLKGDSSHAQINVTRNHGSVVSSYDYHLVHISARKSTKNQKKSVYNIHD